MTPDEIVMRLVGAREVELRFVFAEHPNNTEGIALASGRIQGLNMALELLEGMDVA